MNKLINMFRNMFGNSNEREIKRYLKVVSKINQLESVFESLTDDQLKQKTNEFKARIEKGESLDHILPEAFAVVREVSKRKLGKRHYDVQLIGGMVLHDGQIAEMRTGEGKTLVATLPVYLNALLGKGVHVITANEYLAKRDCEEMGQVYNALDLTVAVNLNGMDLLAKKQAYQSDIVYGTNSEFGFDYLRDNMVHNVEHLAQRPLQFAVIDEVDSILIDEARTPLIISGNAGETNGLYVPVNHFVRSLKAEEDYNFDIKTRTVALTEEGVEKAERMFGVENIFDPENRLLFHHLNQSLKANFVMKRDVDYVVQNGEIMIVDGFTGRTMPGRRYSDGLHQAIEVKENVEIKKESVTFATITIQNYFRMYQKLSGMTGTAKTEEEEFKKIYGLEVIVVPTNKPVIREDKPDVIFKTRSGKYQRVIEEIKECHTQGRPVLIGTTSIEISEHLSELLRKEHVPHQVLNAKYHAEEAEIVSKAGQRGAVTIATNMAGRGTDIILGEDVAEIGGLHIIGTERHESRRIDNQLRGRAGRQGDPGSSQFFLSMEDDLMKRFGAERIVNIMDRLGVDEDEPIEHKMITGSIESAQKRVEGSNFDQRKRVLEYDDVMNRQRQIVYKQRKEVVESEDDSEIVFGMLAPMAKRIVDDHCNESDVPEDWNYDQLSSYLNEKQLTITPLSKELLWGKEREEIAEFLEKEMQNKYQSLKETIGSESFSQIVKSVLLHTVDQLWMEHLDAMEHLREGIHLRAYGGTDPLREYQFEGYEIFNQMIADIQEESVKRLFNIQHA